MSSCSSFPPQQSGHLQIRTTCSCFFQLFGVFDHQISKEELPKHVEKGTNQAAASSFLRKISCIPETPTPELDQSSTFKEPHYSTLKTAEGLLNF